MALRGHSDPGRRLRLLRNTRTCIRGWRQRNTGTHSTGERPHGACLHGLREGAARRAPPRTMEHQLGNPNGRYRSWSMTTARTMQRSLRTVSTPSPNSPSCSSRERPCSPSPDSYSCRQGRRSARAALGSRWVSRSTWLPSLSPFAGSRHSRVSSSGSYRSFCPISAKPCSRDWRTGTQRGSSPSSSSAPPSAWRNTWA